MTYSDLADRLLDRCAEYGEWQGSLVALAAEMNTVVPTLLVAVDMLSRAGHVNYFTAGHHNIAADASSNTAAGFTHSHIHIDLLEVTS